MSAPLVLLARRGRIIVLLVAAACLLQGGGAVDARAATLGGFNGRAQADGLHAFYNPDGVLPLPPFVDIGAPDALATITTGPSSYARASVLDPGDLLANPGALLQAASSSYKSGTVPPYPYRAQATSGYGAPSDESTPGPGLDARASADTSGSNAVATTPQGAAPAIVTFGSMTSQATTVTDKTTVTVHARSEINDVNVLGLLTIDSIVTDLVATTSDAGPVLTGSTTMGGAKLLGQSVSIDEHGISQQSSAPPSTDNPLQGILGGVTHAVTPSANSLLEAAGITITAGTPVQTGNEKAGQLVAPGLRIDFELSRDTQPALESLLDQVPNVPVAIPSGPSFADLITLAQANHVSHVDLAQAQVLLTTTKPATSRPTTPAVTPSAPARVPASSSTGPSGSTGSSFSSTPAASQDALPAAAPAAAPSLFAASVGAALLLLLLALPFVGDRVARLAERVLATEGGGACSWEER